MSENKTIGIIYSAFGTKYIQEMIKSARSVKKYHPHLKITAFVDQPTKLNHWKKLFDQIHTIDLSQFKGKGYTQTSIGRFTKVQAMATFPYDINLYLDVDTRVRRKIDNLFDKLDPTKKNKNSYDLAIANSPRLNKKTTPYSLVNYIKEKSYNSGVIIYRKNDRMQKVFELWIHNCLAKINLRKLDDQSELQRIINHQLTPIKTKIISNKKYNARHTMIPQLKSDGLYSKIKITHQSF